MKITVLSACLRMNKKYQNVAFWSTSPGVLIHAQHFAPETVAGMLQKVEKKVCFLWRTEHSLSP